MKIIIAAIVAALALLTGPASAQTPFTYQYQTPGGIVHILAGQVGGNVLPYSEMVDAAGSPFGVAANPMAIGFGTGVTLPSFATTQHFICDSGCSSVSTPFGQPIGANGSAIGFKDGFGNLQPVLGDSTNGLWVSIKGAISLPVTGTFWQATQPVSAASLPLPTGAATQTTLAAIQTALGSPMQAGGTIGNTAFGISGTLPAFAATPTFNIGTAPMIAVTGTFFQATQPVSIAATVGVNQTQMNGVAVLAGNGVSGTGSQRVNIASDNTAFSVNAAQSGTWNVTNISGTITLPTGASTATNQTSEQSPVAAAAATATKSVLVGAQFLSAQPTMTNTQQASLLTSARGEVLVAPGASGFAVSVSGTPSVNLAQTNGVSILTSAGTVGAGSQRIAVGQDNTTVAGSSPGSTGTDSSANAASIPADANAVLLTTIAANASRASVGVQNQSGATLQVVRDDGSGSNQTSIFLAGPYNIWTSQTFKGRVRVYGITGIAVAAYQD